MTYQATTSVANASNQAQILKTLALQVYNDATLLLGDIATLQTSINSGTATVADMFEMGNTIQDLVGQLQYIDNYILKLQQATNG